MKDEGKGSTCCVPQASRGEAKFFQTAVAIQPQPFSPAGMKRLGGGTFLMGSEGREIWPRDGEGPVRQVKLDTQVLGFQCSSFR